MEVVNEVDGTVVLQHCALGAACAARGEDDVAHVGGASSAARRHGRELSKRRTLFIDLSSSHTAQVMICTKYRYSTKHQDHLQAHMFVPNVLTISRAHQEDMRFGHSALLDKALLAD